MTRMLIAIKPDALINKKEIYDILKNYDINVVSRVFIKCDEEIYNQLYSDIDKALDNMNRHYLLNQYMEISIIESKLSYFDMLSIVGRFGDPNMCEKNSLRYIFGNHTPINKNGISFYFNAIHKSSEKTLEDDVKWFYNKLQIKNIYNIIKNIAIENGEMERFELHILPVLNYSRNLAVNLNANITACEICALCHDVSKLKKIKNDHEIWSVKWIKEFLTNNKFPSSIVKYVEKSIKNHSNSFNGKRLSLEEKILATSDAMSHIDHPLPILRNIFVKTLDLKMVKSLFIEKLERSYRKIYFNKEEYKTKINNLKEVLK